MKLVIPSKVQIGCRTFDIRMNDSLMEELDLKAQLVDSDDLIRMRQRSPTSMFESLIHELMHEVFYMCDLQDGEDSIRPLGVLMTQALMSLGIEPDFSKIPDEEVT